MSKNAVAVKSLERIDAAPVSEIRARAAAFLASL
jgi:hypothetical protein